MPALSNPWSGNTDLRDPIIGTDLATWLDAIRTVVNAIDNTNIAAAAGINVTKLDKSVLTAHYGASTTYKWMTGSKSIATGAANNYRGANALITYTADCDTTTGATAFSGTPVRVFAIPISNQTDAIEVKQDSAAGLTTCQLNLTAEVGTTLPDPLVVQWIAIGPA